MTPAEAAARLAGARHARTTLAPFTDRPIVGFLTDRLLVPTEQIAARSTQWAQPGSSPRSPS